MAIPTKVLTYLESNGVAHKVIDHKKVFTAYDLANTLKRKLSTIAKTLVVKTEQGYALVVLPAHYRLDLKKLKKALGAQQVTIANEQVMQKVFKVKPGAITAFGAIHRVPVVLEQALAKTSKALFGAGSFTESIELKLAAYRKLEDPQVASFGTKSLPEVIKPQKVQKKRTKKKRVAKKRPAKRKVAKRTPARKKPAKRRS